MRPTYFFVFVVTGIFSAGQVARAQAPAQSPPPDSAVSPWPSAAQPWGDGPPPPPLPPAPPLPYAHWWNDYRGVEVEHHLYAPRHHDLRSGMISPQPVRPLCNAVSDLIEGMLCTLSMPCRLTHRVHCHVDDQSYPTAAVSPALEPAPSAVPQPTAIQPAPEAVPQDPAIEPVPTTKMPTTGRTPPAAISPRIPLAAPQSSGSTRSTLIQEAPAFVLPEDPATEPATIAPPRNRIPLRDGASPRNAIP